MGFVEHYTEQQRLAIAEAYADRGIRPARRVVELAKAGELGFRGEALAPFATTESSVRTFARVLRKRRAGETTSKLADMPAPDSVDALRRRLVNACDEAVASIERRQRKDRGKVQWEEIRQAVRVLRELAALPAPGGRGIEPGQRGPGGQRDGGASRGGLAGSLLAAHRARPPVLNGSAEVPAEPRNDEIETDHEAEPDPVETLVAGMRERLQATSDGTG
jgi:hypothetical protein